VLSMRGRAAFAKCPSSCRLAALYLLAELLASYSLCCLSSGDAAAAAAAR